MKIQKVKDVEVFHRAKGVNARKIIDNNNIQLVQIVIDAGETLPKHNAPFDIFVYIIEGSGKLVAGDETVIFHSDMVYELEAKTMHEITNTGETPLKILVGKLVRTKA